MSPRPSTLTPRRTRYLAILDELIDLGADLARRIHAQATETPATTETPVTETPVTEAPATETPATTETPAADTPAAAAQAAAAQAAAQAAAAQATAAPAPAPKTPKPPTLDQSTIAFDRVTRMLRRTMALADHFEHAPTPRRTILARHSPAQAARIRRDAAAPRDPGESDREIRHPARLEPLEPMPNLAKLHDDELLQLADDLGLPTKPRTYTWKRHPAPYAQPAHPQRPLDPVPPTPNPLHHVVPDPKPETRPQLE